MKIVFASVENSLAAIGFRKMAALVRRTWPQLEVLHVVPFRAASPLNRILAKPYEYRGDPEIDAIACYLAKSDMVCFSSMSTKGFRQPDIKQARSSGSFATALILILSLIRPPRRIYDLLRKKLVRHGRVAQVHPLVLKVLLSSINVKRALAHILHGHFGVLPSRTTWLLWKTGLVGRMNRRILRKGRSIEAESLS